MTVVPIQPPGLKRIRNPGLRAAAERFEAATGERLAHRFDLSVDEGVLGLFLIMRGYSPYDRSELR